MRALAGCLVCVVAAGAWAAAGAEEIGKVVTVRSQVLAIESGKPPRQLVKLDPVANGLRVRLTQPDSLLRVAFYDSKKPPLREAPRSLKIDGSLVFRGKGEAVISQRRPADESKGGIITTIETLWGRLLLMLRPGQNHEAEVKTPDLASGIKGTAVRVLVDQAFGTFLAVDEGVAVVQAVAGGDPVVVKSGQWVLVPPGGLPTQPESLDGGVDILDEPPLQSHDVSTEPPEPPQ